VKFLGNWFFLGRISLDKKRQRKFAKSRSIRKASSSLNPKNDMSPLKSYIFLLALNH